MPPRLRWVWAALLCATVLTAAAAAKPNILFIAVDDQNDWVGFLGGHPLARTPYMDGLARRGTVFANAHCQAPLCNPSRTSVMTGLRPSTTGVHGLEPWFRTLPTLRDHATLPQALARQGYRTLSAGKIFHGGYGRQKGDSEFQVLGPASSVGVRPKEKLVTTPFGNHPLVDWGVFDHRDEDKGDWKMASWAEEQLNARPAEPFFLSVGFFLPHVPCYVTQRWLDLYPDNDLVLPAVKHDDRDDTPRFSWHLHWTLPEPRLKFLEDARQWRHLVRAYLASTSFVDSQVGRVLEAVRRNGYDRNTIIVLWSDHGWHLGEKLVTGKNTLWEESTRVPLVFAGPGVAVGATCTQPVELLDMYPTLLELCGLPAQKGLEGHSLLPQLRDARAVRPWPAITTHNQGNHAVRSERWRYIRYADGSEELYDLAEDPHEWRNLAAQPQHAPVLAQHRVWLPKTDRPSAPGSASRILRYENGRANWEGKDIAPGAPIPGL